MRRSALMRALVLPLAMACSTTPTRGVDPCALVTRDDAREILGAAFDTAEAASHTSGGIAVWQCYFRMPASAGSFTVEVTRAGSARETRRLWEAQFEQGEERDRDRDAGERNELHALEVKGVGEDALWTGNRVSGVLYIRAQDAIVRINIGGAAPRTVKMEQSRALAKRILQALPCMLANHRACIISQLK